MNLVLAHCGKEWRSQRALLVAYALLVFVCLSIGFLLLPKSWWLIDGQGAFALSCFVATGVLGVLAFAAPALVKNEFAAKGDQFVRRLPGALVPSFAGKLLFLLLVTQALPLVALLWGELFLQAIGQRWDDLFRWYWDGSVELVWSWPALFSGYVLLLTPWVWAVGTWLPGGRMAVGGVVLLVLLLGIGVIAVLRQHPNLERGLAWQRWLWAVAPLGAAVAGLAWTQGRRGGGPLRSARIGATAMLVGFVPPAAWLGAEAWRYRNPDPQALVTIDVRGSTPDLRFAFVLGNEHDEWLPAGFRVDLATGAAEQVHDQDAVMVPAVDNLGRSTTRYWRLLSGNHLVQWWFDLATGERTPLALDDKGNPILTDAQRRIVRDEARQRTPYRAPGDRRMWLDGADLCVESQTDEVERVAVGGRVHVRPKGHGFVVSSSTEPPRLFDPTTRSWMMEPADFDGFLVRDLLVSRKTVGWTWQRQRSGAMPEACDALRGARVLGLFDDDQLLCQRPLPSRQWRLFLYHAAEDAVRELDVVPGSMGYLALHPFGGATGSLLPRDPAGRVWVLDQRGRNNRVVLLDVRTRRVTALSELAFGNASRLLAWPDSHSVLVSTSPAAGIASDARIERIDLDTGARTILFPRPRSTN